MNIDALLVDKSFNTSLLFIINALSFWFSFLVHHSNPRAPGNRFFLLFSLSTLVWINAAYFFTFSENLEQALALAKIGVAGVFPFLVFFYLFSVYFLNKKEKMGAGEKLLIGWGTLFFLVSLFSDLMIETVRFTPWGTDIVFGFGGRILFYGTVIAFTSLAVYSLFKNYAKLVPEEKTRIQYFLLGLIISIGMNVFFNVVLPLLQGTIKYWQLGNYSTIFLLGFAAYAIVAKQLFGVRIVLVSFFVGLITILLILDALLFTIPQPFKWLIVLTFLVFGYLLVRSVSKEIQYREKLQLAYGELKKLDKAKSEFISIASHQLRTPLSVIKGYLSLGLEGTYGQIGEKFKPIAQKIYQANERLIKLVNDLLDISRIEAGKIELEKEMVSLEELLTNAIETFKVEAKNKGLYLRLERPEQRLPSIYLDKEKISQAILNIIDNAIRYTDDGGIVISLKKEENNVLIEIKDTGEGIDEEEMTDLFESFSRGTAGSRYWTEGAGLGLYVSQKFITMHNGKIWAESEGKGKGSSFFIELPV